MRGKRHILLPLLVGTCAALLVALALAQPWQAHIDLGGLSDYPFVRGFHATEYSPEHQTNFRWSRPEAALVLPGAGRVAPLIVRVHGDDTAMPLTLDAGAGPVSVPLRHGWQRLSLLPRPAPWSGDVTLSITAPPQVSVADERIRGVVFDRVSLGGRGNLPPWLQVIFPGVSVALAMLLVGWCFRRWWVGTMAGVLLAAAWAGVLVLHQGAWRLMLTCFSGRLALVLACGVLLVAGIDRLLALLNRGRVASDLPSPRTGEGGGGARATRGVFALGADGRRMLAGAALLAFVLRFAGMAYPLTFISDLRFTMARATMVREGHLLDLFLPNPSLTPYQWNTEATVPRSPFYYILASPLTALPGEADRLAVMAFSSAIDALAVLIVALIVLHAGGGRRAAVLAAVLAASIPLGLMAAMSWGLFPTLLAQSLVLLAMLAWLVLKPCLPQGRAWLVLAAALTIAYIAYPTALLFLGTTWFLLLVLLALRRDPATVPTLRAGLLAAVLALLLFYGWHIPAMLAKTLPMMGERAAGHTSGGDAPGVRDLLNAIWIPFQAKYSLLVRGLAALGGVLLLAKPLTRRAADVRLLLIAWVLTFPPMSLISEMIVPFILKDVLYLLPALAILAGLFLGGIVQRRAGRIVAAAAVALVVWQGLLLEYDSIVHGFTQLKW